MTDIEVALTDIGELATRELVKRKKPDGLDENIKIARIGGSVANNTRMDFEEKLGESVITSVNNMNYEYVKQNEIK